jgi:hypothetical protein
MIVTVPLKVVAAISLNTNTINLSSNNGSVTDSISITTTLYISKPSQPVFSFVDTGLLNNDGITNNGVITINNLEVNATWQYSSCR